MVSGGLFSEGVVVVGQRPGGLNIEIAVEVTQSSVCIYVLKPAFLHLSSVNGEQNTPGRWKCEIRGPVIFVDDKIPLQDA